ncbi:MAG: RNA-binding protein [Proteobacteria bacterium]|nr:RNA-binding protein [Pseudomonadota bacterium]NOG60921.1 RNA-binding protein [Pseudomonadota bacterium]
MKKDESLDNIRLDKWLWCARFYKTRALAASAIKGNKIRVNDLAVKAAKSIRIGDRVLIRKTPYQYSITILKLSKHRLSASQAALLYEEDAQSILAREELAKQIKADSASFPRTIGRPTKRNRREIIRFTRTNQNNDNSE